MSWTYSSNVFKCGVELAAQVAQDAGLKELECSSRTCRMWEEEQHAWDVGMADHPGTVDAWYRQAKEVFGGK